MRLGARRRACVAQDPHQTDRQSPLHTGMQRRRDDADPAPQGERILRSGDRSIRAALRRRSAVGRIMALVVHPYIMGAPHRLRYFCDALAHIRDHGEVLFWTGEDILDWYLAQ